MENKYCDFIDEITADELYEGLLGYGMFADMIAAEWMYHPYHFEMYRILRLFQSLPAIYCLLV